MALFAVFLFREGVAAVFPQAAVDVATVARLGGDDLGHEAEALAVLLGDLLGPLFEHHVPVRHRQRGRVDEVHLVLALAPLALGRLDGNAGRLHLLPQRVHDRLVARRLERVVVDAVIA